MWIVSTKCQKKKFKEWFKLLQHGNFEKPFQIEQLSRPDFVGDKVVPSDLNELTFGQVIQLQSIKGVKDMFFSPAIIILGMNEREVMRTNAVDVVRFSAWVSQEMLRINKLFASTNRKPTDKEKKAGIELLKFGIFGMVDWFALRMGIRDHEEVMDVPWMRVYKCLQIDSEKDKFERRLRKVYEDEYRK